MTLTAGTRLGPYEIERPLGAGGMGEVYQARDTRLDRSVAVKILRSADAVLQQRFEREARAISALDHPHICALYDVRQERGHQFLVMQYVEGETLAARLTRGALPLDQALRYGIEIADALAHAHRQGIVHRDLKPANVMLTRTGVKLLDFGLAKLQAPATEPGVGSLAMTKSPGLTAEGTILGTLHYMAPEQLEGKEADARSDIFAFGAVLYEMVTGTKAFDGSSPATVIASILNTQPPALSTRQPLTPPAVDHVVAACLAKDPDDRWQSAADVKRELEWIAASGAAASTDRVAAAAAWTRRSVLVPAALALLTLGVVAGILGERRVDPVASHRFRVTRSTLLAGLPIEDEFELSPDGARLAYSGRDGRLYLRGLNEFDAKLLAEQARFPFFSPDGQWIGFSSDGRLLKVPVNGGPPQLICERDAGWGATWGVDGTIVFSPSATSGLYRVSAGGGTPQVLTKLETGEKSHRWPHFLPGAQAVLFTVQTPEMSSHDEARVAVVSIDTKARRVILTGGTAPRYVATGHLVYFRNASVVAVPFDVTRLETTAPSATVLDDVPVTIDGNAPFSVAENGSVAYSRGTAGPRHARPVWVDPHRKAEPLTDDARVSGGGLRLSPDGQRLAVEVEGPNDQIWIYDLARRTFSRLTTEWNNSSPKWTPDGKRITFWSDRSGTWNLYWQPADGSGPAERLTESPRKQAPGSWTPDGKTFAFTQEGLTGKYEIWLLTMPEHRVRPLIQRPYFDQSPTISPDGRWLAFLSDETGRNEIYVQPFPQLGAKWQISTGGAFAPRWEPTHGRELYYQNGDKLMAVSIRTSPTFAAGAPRVLFTGPYEESGYDVSKDGRFIMSEHLPSPTDIVLIQNWFEELKTRMSAR